MAYYSWSSTLLIDDVDRYIQLIEDFELEMIPNNYDELKQDKAFLYFLRSLKNHFYWKIEVSQKSIKKQASDIIKNIDAELKTLNK